MIEAVILFDGVCNLCNGAVDFILRNEAGRELRFAVLQSDVGRRLAKNCGVQGEEMHTVVLIDGEKCYTGSTAVLRIGGKLRYPWRLISILLIVPRFIRDAVYQAVAKRRYRWFGRRTSCRLPTADERDRFLG